MASDMDFVVRNVAGTANLDGAFRVHLAPEAIQQASLVFNETCEIASEGGQRIGCGIVWRAAEKLGSTPKTKPARLTEAMREAFGIKEGSVVKLSPSKSGILHADKVVLTDISPHPQGEYNGAETQRWHGRCRIALYNAEAIASGAAFEVTAKKGMKKRFVVENIGSSRPTPAGPHLYYVDDETKLVFGQGTDSAPQSPGIVQNGERFRPISTDGIGGLVEQIQALNTSIRLALQQARRASQITATTSRNRAVILHGYEGTGKSALLSRIPETGFRRAIHIDTQTLDGTTAAKKKAIAERFEEARAQQPSVILMDNLHRLAPAGEASPLTETLCSQLDSISESNVLVVAATRSLQAVHGDLLGPGRFIKEIELQIPDLAARLDILSALFSHRTVPMDDTTLKNLGANTHGFTSRDLAKLVELAEMNAIERGLDGPPWRDFPESPEQTHDAAPETPAPQKYDTEPVKIEQRDWTFALSRVRPAALREILFTTPQTSWSDIGGSGPVRSKFDKVIGWPLHHGDLMKRHKLPAKKGMLLYGPPGCSKTLTAQAIAATYSTNFIVVKGAELISSYVGESERAVRETFRKARTARPCIIFFDEIDAIASERESGGGGSKGLNVLTTLLNEMDGFDSLSGVFVLAATNKPEALDPAIMRPGRFDTHVYLPPPDDAARRDIFGLQLTGRAKEDDLDVDKLVRATAGYTGAEVVAVCQVAKECVVERELAKQGGTMRMDDFERAFAEVKPRVTREMLAAYEAFANR